MTTTQPHPGLQPEYQTPEYQAHHAGAEPSAPHRAMSLDELERYHRRRDEVHAGRARMAELRGQVAHRLRTFNANHADHAWTSRHHHPIAAHALAMFYAEPAPTGGWELRTAPRLLPENPDVADPARLLFDLTEIARQVTADGLDPRVEMSERPEPMGPPATYLGVGLSTLDTPGGAWREVRARASSGVNVPGRFYVLLIDDSAMLADRRPRHEIRSYFVHSTHWLGPQWYEGQDWQHLPDLLQHDPQTSGPIWYRLRELHAVLAAARSR